MSVNFENILNSVEKNSIKENVMLKDCTTFKVGGPATVFIEPKNVDELVSLMAAIKREKCPFFIIGNGSNLLVSDNGFDGVVVRLAGDFLDIKTDGNKLYAGAAAMVTKLSVVAKDNALTGLEFAYGIPGTVGGAMVMNAGAYDGEMAFVVKWVDMLDDEGSIVRLSNEEMEFSYRNSILKRKPFIVLRTCFELTEGNKDEINAKMMDFLERRKSKQPLEYPSAGSTFKRPQGNFAGKIIMEAGLAGKRVGGACVSTKHCGFVVNDDNATAKDIDELINQVIEKVKEDTNIILEPEVIRVGLF